MKPSQATELMKPKEDGRNEYAKKLMKEFVELMERKMRFRDELKPAYSAGDQLPLEYAEYIEGRLIRIYNQQRQISERIILL